jgi:hypothetical protein
MQFSKLVIDFEKNAVTFFLMFLYDGNGSNLYYCT